MIKTRLLLVLGSLFTLSAPAFAEDKCNVKAAVKSVGWSINVAGAPFPSRQWTYELPKDTEIIKIEKLTGKTAPGGKLSGRITGGKASDGLKYSWEADFDFTLPAKSAAFGGQGCGS